MDSFSDIEDFYFDEGSIAKKKVPTLQVLTVMTVSKVINNPFDIFKLPLPPKITADILKKYSQKKLKLLQHLLTKFVILMIFFLIITKSYILNM